MGFLNHSTNNIIIDAVLTEKGRELLSRNDQSFDIDHFKLSDDEVDYSLITKYGNIIGKEKIEKNTPIFEALTGEDISIKYPLLNLDDVTNLLYLPSIIDINASSNAYYPISSTTSSNTSNSNSVASISIKTSIPGVGSNFTLTDSLVDNDFWVIVHKSLLRISDNEWSERKSQEDTVAYKISGRPDSSNREYSGQRFATFKLSVSGDFTNDMYNLFAPNDNIIRTEVKVIGYESGATLIIPIEISLNG